MRRLGIVLASFMLLGASYDLSSYDLEVNSLTCVGSPCGSEGAGLSNGDKGDIVLSGSPAGSQWDIEAGAVGTNEVAALDTADITTGELANLVNNCVIANSATPIPSSCISGGGGGISYADAAAATLAGF